MDRKEFLSKVGLGVAVAAVTPCLLIPEKAEPFVVSGDITFGNLSVADEAWMILYDEDGKELQRFKVQSARLEVV